MIGRLRWELAGPILCAALMSDTLMFNFRWSLSVFVMTVDEFSCGVASGNDGPLTMMVSRRLYWSTPSMLVYSSLTFSSNPTITSLSFAICESFFMSSSFNNSVSSFIFLVITRVIIFTRVFDSSDRESSSWFTVISIIRIMVITIGVQLLLLQIELQLANCCCGCCCWSMDRQFVCFLAQ